MGRTWFFFPSWQEPAFLAAGELRGLSGSLKYFLLGAAVLVGLGTSTSPQSPAETLAKWQH